MTVTPVSGEEKYYVDLDEGMVWDGQNNTWGNPEDFCTYLYKKLWPNWLYGPPTAGGMNLQSFKVNYNDPGLAVAGKSLWTPNVGDMLISMWIDLVTPWDGTTPRLTMYLDSVGGQIMWGGTSVGTAATMVGMFRNPARAMTTTPYVVAQAGSVIALLNTTGTPAGVDPGSTQGEAVVYMLTNTSPAAM